MSLSAHLLIRMTLVGLLCWFGVSGFVVWRLQQEGRGTIEAQADILQRLTEQQLRRQLVAQDAGGRLPDLARVVAGVLERGRHAPEVAAQVPHHGPELLAIYARLLA